MIRYLVIMRYGFTTGSCAAAASKAAAYMLLTGNAKNKITIQTPKGIAYTADITDIKRSENEVSCAVIKDGGDDPDVTTGAYIYASVRILHSDTSALCKKKQDLVIINIDGGDGVGRVTKPGLDQPVGNAAINHVPREMIEKEVREVCELLDFKGTLDITISVPKGKELAEKTAGRLIKIENEIFDSWTGEELEQYIRLTGSYLEQFREKIGGLGV